MKNFKGMFLILTLAIGISLSIAKPAHADTMKDLIDKVTKLENQISALQATIACQAATIEGLQNANNALSAKVSALDCDLNGVRANRVLALSPYVCVEDGYLNGLKGPHIISTGANVHVSQTRRTMAGCLPASEIWLSATTSRGSMRTATRTQVTEAARII